MTKRKFVRNSPVLLFIQQHLSMKTACTFVVMVEFVLCSGPIASTWADDSSATEKYVKTRNQRAADIRWLDALGAPLVAVEMGAGLGDDPPAKMFPRSALGMLTTWGVLSDARLLNRWVSANQATVRKLRALPAPSGGLKVTHGATFEDLDLHLQPDIASVRVHAYLVLADAWFAKDPEVLSADLSAYDNMIRLLVCGRSETELLAGIALEKSKLEVFVAACGDDERQNRFRAIIENLVTKTHAVDLADTIREYVRPSIVLLTSRGPSLWAGTKITDQRQAQLLDRSLTNLADVIVNLRRPSDIETWERKMTEDTLVRDIVHEHLQLGTKPILRKILECEDLVKCLKRSTSKLPANALLPALTVLKVKFNKNQTALEVVNDKGHMWILPLSR